MSLVEIKEVTLTSFGAERLLGRSIDLPAVDSKSDSYSICLAGWVVGRDSPATAVEVIDDDDIHLRTIPLDVARPDIAALFPALPQASRSGFYTSLSVLGLPHDFELQLVVILTDRRIPLGVIRGTRRSLQAGPAPGLQPLMVTALGRSGTSWLLHLLLMHPQVVGVRQFPYEFGIARYWMHTLRVVADTANALQSAHADNFQYNMHWIGHNPFYNNALMTREPALFDWFGRDNIQDLARFCQSRIDNAYQILAATNEQDHGSYFAEKCAPCHIQTLLWELYPGAREVFLIRDFRDVLSSMFAFVQKRGVTAFGLNSRSSAREYLIALRGSAHHLLNGWRRRANRAHLLRYEDLVHRPKDTLDALWTYLGITMSDATARDILQAMFERSTEVEHHRSTETAVASIGRWRRDLSPDVQRLSEQMLGEVLLEFGYLSEDTVAVEENVG